MSRPSTPGVPYVDPDVEFVETDRLKELSASRKLRRLRKTCVIQEDGSPLAVLMPFRTFMAVQETINELEDSVEAYRDDYDHLSEGDSTFDFGSEGFDEMDALLGTRPVVTKDGDEEDEAESGKAE